MRRQVLLDRHPGTERFGTSLYKLYQSIDQILAARYQVHHLDAMYRFFSKDAKTDYLSQFMSCDVAVLGNVSILVKLRSLGWQGKVMLTALGSLPRGGAAIRQVISVLQPQDVVLLSSTADMDIWNWFFRLAPRAEMIPFGVDTISFHPVPSVERDTLRAQLGYSDKDKLILYSGRITVEKNVHSILPILAELIHEHPNYILLIAGKFEQVPFRMFDIDVNIEERVNSLAEELGIPKRNLRFFSYLNQDDLVRLYHVADVLMNLSLHHDENFGYAQVEAMACGTPVLANAWGGMKDTVKDNDSGYLIPTWVTASGIRFDTHLAKERLVEMLEDDAQRTTFGHNAIARVREHFSMETFAKQLINVIEDDQFGPKEFKFSPQGLKYAWRFSQKEENDTVVKLSALQPRYSSYHDEDYVHVIRHYTSRSTPKIRNEGLCYKPSYWHHGERTPEGGFKIINDDPLWPHDSTVHGIEMEILEFVFSQGSAPVSILQERWGEDCIENIERLVHKGYLNCSG